MWRTSQGQKRLYDSFVAKKNGEREQLGGLELEGKTVFESYSILINEGRIHLVQNTCS
jgi:hypothetical protein